MAPQKHGYWHSNVRHRSVAGQYHDGEGFVAIGTENGAVKLVDRMEFSKNNFNAVKNWSKG